MIVFSTIRGYLLKGKDPLLKKMWLARMCGRVLLSYSRMHMAHFLQISNWFAEFQLGQRGGTLVLNMIILLILLHSY